MEISARSYAMTITKTADTLGISLPASYLEHIDQAQALAEAVAAIAKTSSGDLDLAVLNALDAGRDYRTDETVQNLIVDRALAQSGIEHSARTYAETRLRLTLADLADDTLNAWADALHPHSASLVAAAKAGLDLENPADVIAKGGNNMQIMHDAQAAVNAWLHAVRGFNAFAAIRRMGYYGPEQAPLILTPARKAELTPAYELTPGARTNIDAWTLARCGIPLELATLDEFKARAAAFEADQQAEARAEAEARQQRVTASW
jgi:hypothetical protein